MFVEMFKWNVCITKTGKLDVLKCQRTLGGKVFIMFAKMEHSLNVLFNVCITKTGFFNWIREHST